VVKSGRRDDCAVSHERDVGGRVGILGQVSRRPDDSSHVNRGQYYPRWQHGAIQHLLSLIGPVSAQMDHRPDACLQNPRSRFVDHHFAGA